MSGTLPFPSPRGRRARIEAIVAHLIDLLDAMDAPGADHEPEPDEEDDAAEVSAAPLSLGATLAPQKRIRRGIAA